MIKVERPSLVPQKLLVEGAQANLQNRSDYDTDPDSYINCIIEFEILNGIYGHATVKSVLRDFQYNKCCFCEKDQREENGAVEHFRPKRGFQQNRKDKIEKPGYFWLGYTWTNLLFSCTRCNGKKYKGNNFPLVLGSIRARSHHNDLALEDPYLIDPATIDPRLHITFDNELIKYNTIYGEKTIKVLGLDRADLNDMRKELIDEIKSRIITIRLHKYFDPKEVQEAKLFLVNAQKSSAKFSSMAIDFITNAGVKLD